MATARPHSADVPTHPVESSARPGGRRVARLRRGPLVASLAVHGLVLVLGTVAIRRPMRAGPPVPAGTVSLDLPNASDALPDDGPEVLDDVESEPLDPPPMRSVPDPAAPPPDDEGPLPAEAEPDGRAHEGPEREHARPPSVPAPPDPTRRTRRSPPVAAPQPAPSTSVAVGTARGARPPLVAVSSPMPPLVPGGTPGTTLVVVLEYTIGPDGAVTDAVVRTTSGSAALDASTRAFVVANWRYAPPGEVRRVARRFVFTYGS